MKKIDFRLFLSSFLFFFGVYISYIRGSNFSDGDSYSLINAFLNFLNENKYTPSRGAYGHPIPELLIGFLAYNFGTRVSNIFCFILFYISIIFFYKAFLKRMIKIKIYLLYLSFLTHIYF